jgi:hypothetical protein
MAVTAEDALTEMVRAWTDAPPLKTKKAAIRKTNFEMFEKVAHRVRQIPLAWGIFLFLNVAAFFLCGSVMEETF